jgi:hypothetical protein
MILNEGQQKILDIIAEKSNFSVNTSVFDTAVIQASGLPANEVKTYFSQLEGFGLIKMGIKASGADFRLINATKEGLEASSHTQELR